MALQLSTPDFSLLKPIAEQMTPGINAIMQGAQLQQQNAKMFQEGAMQRKQMQGMDQDRNIKNMDTINQMTGAISMLPADKQPQAYQAAMSQAQSMGLNTTGFPAEWGDEAQAKVQNAYYQSGQALNWYKAQSEMGLKQAALGLQQQGNVAGAAEKAASLQSQGLPVPSQLSAIAGQQMIGQGGGSNLATPPPLQGGAQAPMPGQPGMQGQMPQQPIQQGQVPPQQQQAAAQQQQQMAQAVQQRRQAVAAMQMDPKGNPLPSLGTYGDINGSQANTNPNAPLAQLEGQKKKEADWSEFGDTLSKNEQNYMVQKQAIDNTETYAHKVGWASGYLFAKDLKDIPTQAGKDANTFEAIAGRMNLDVTAGLTKAGLSRVTNPVIKTVKFITPGMDKYEQANMAELAGARGQNEISHMTAQLYPAMDSLGIHSPVAAMQMANDALGKTGAIGKDGTYDEQAASQWKNFLPAPVQQYMKNNPTAPAPKYVDANGQDITDKIAQVHNIQGAPLYNKSYDDIAASFGGKRVTQNPIEQLRNPPPAPQTSMRAPQQQIDTSALAPTPQARIQQVKQMAMEAHPDNPVMAQLAAAQAIQESRLLGKPSTLASQHNNLFGIKAPGTAGTTNMNTNEFMGGRNQMVNAGFGQNKTMQDSFQQHADLMNKSRYTAVRQAKSFPEAAYAVQRAGYATDPNYAASLINIQRKYLQDQ
jgi:flagellum-specific peptidoglycan hydrolase FlgJ